MLFLLISPPLYLILVFLLISPPLYLVLLFLLIPPCIFFLGGRLHAAPVRLPAPCPVPPAPPTVGPIPEGGIPEGPIPEGPISEGPILEGPIPEGEIPEGVRGAGWGCRGVWSAVGAMELVWGGAYVFESIHSSFYLYLCIPKGTTGPIPGGALGGYGRQSELWSLSGEVCPIIIKRRLKYRLSPVSFPRPTRKTGPGNKKTVTKHANYSIRLHPPAFINSPLKISSGDKCGHM